jgi:hypothetical protein
MSKLFSPTFSLYDKKEKINFIVSKLYRGQRNQSPGTLYLLQRIPIKTNTTFNVYNLN